MFHGYQTHNLKPSANAIQQPDSAAVMKLTYIKKSNEPYTDPCGTPEVTGMERLVEPDIGTDIVRAIWKLLIYKITIGSKP